MTNLCSILFMFMMTFFIILSAHYDDVEEKDLRVKYMWEALKNFSNEDRSRFLRFITGRRRLPASLYISTGRG